MGTSYSTIKQVEKIVRDVEAQRAKKPSNMFLLTSLVYIICKKLVHQLGVTGQEPD
jgi:hypothetical protein